MSGYHSPYLFRHVLHSTQPLHRSDTLTCGAELARDTKQQVNLAAHDRLHIRRIALVHHHETVGMAPEDPRLF